MPTFVLLRRLFALLAVVVVAGLVWAARPDPAARPQPAAAEAVSLPELSPRYRSVRHEIAEGDTASVALRALLAEGGTSPAAPVAAAILGAAGSALNHLSIGDVLRLDYRDGESTPWRLEVEADGPMNVGVVRTGEAWASERRPIPYVIATGVRDLVISSSLWEAALDAGLRPSQVMAVAEIFQYDVDFNTELVKDARLRLVADTLTADDGSTRIGAIRAARLENGGKRWTAIRFVGSDGAVGWFAADGSGGRRPFLRSPLEFSRVTSSFSLNRFHPLLGYSRAHVGVDLGAPTGTPIRAVADGVVTQAGWHGGHGNHVELRHEAPYATGYSHLSAILVKRGQKVKQGEIIGRVGSTGLSTGPHLHYEFKVNGAYRDPMTIALPTTGTLSISDVAAFNKVRDEVVPLLEKGPG